MDVLKTHRYLVEVIYNQIVDVEMVEKHGDSADIPLELLYYEKVKGKTPLECEVRLGFGPPLISLRSINTGQLGQVFDARLIKELPKPHYCVVRYDLTGRCDKVDLVEVDATAK